MTIELELYNLVQTLMDAQVQLNPTCNGSGSMGDSVCYASAFTAVGAAFSTMGYWVQSDLLDQIIYSGMGLWAPLLYILSAAGGMVSMALGQPPRTYLWFFMGPAIFNWMLDTRTEVTGVAWRVADRYQDQTEVWKLAEVGLVNTHLFDRVVAMVGGPAAATGFITANRAPQLPNQIDFVHPGTGGANSRDYMVSVAMPFLWFDALISDTIQNMVRWTGIYTERQYQVTGTPYSGGGNTGVGSAPRSNLNENPAQADSQWFLLSNLKWSYLDDITGAKLANPLVRDAFVTFLGSECGDMMKASVHAPAFTAAAHTRGFGVPTSIFKADNDQFFNYRILKTNLRSKAIPTPETLKEVLQERKGNAFRFAIETVQANHSPPPGTPKPNWYPDDMLDAVLISNRIRCDTYLDLLVLFFRWEASNIYQMTFVNSAGVGGLDDKQIVYNLLYGWDIKKDRSRAIIAPGTVGGVSGTYLKVGDGAPLTADEQVYFIHNLILVHLFRNEFATAPAPVDVRYSMSDQAVNYVQAYQRTIGSKSKYGEIYTWALMIPYIQGVLMYLLAIGYPFACILIVMPGMHKVIFTWMSFWAWVKMWDLGFAIVMSLERSVWAMIGNKSQITSVFDRIVEMDIFGRNQLDPVNCNVNPKSMGGCLSRYYELAGPQVYSSGPGARPGGLRAIYTLGAPGSPMTIKLPAAPSFGSTTPVTGFENIKIDLMDSNLRFLDLGMTLGASLDLDLANGYYIYIMAALYMAVPAVTGQLVLGAKAGAASMVGTAIGGAAQESGRVAGTGYQGDVVQRMKSNASSLGQAVTAKSHRNSGLAASALGMGNAAAGAGMQAAYNDQVGRGHGNLMSIAGNNKSENEAAGGLGVAATTSAAGLLAGGGKPRQKDDPNAPAGAGGNGQGGQSLGNSLGNIRRATGTNNARQDGLLKRAMTGDGLYRTLGAANSLGNARAYGQQAAQHIAGQADSGIRGFGYGQQSKGFGEHAGRTNAAANYRAGMDKWKAMTQFANQLGGTSAALGLFAGGMDAGPKPEEATGMAMSGMLGADAKDKANYFDPSRKDGFFGIASGMQGNLSRSYGGQRMLDARESGTRTPHEQFMSAMGTAANEFSRLNPTGPQGSGASGGN